MSTAFERALLKDATVEARKLGAVVANAWVHRTMNQWEFHYGDFYWWGRAENAWHAKAKGWEAWVAKMQSQLEAAGNGSPSAKAKAARSAKGITLQQLSRMTGYAVSTLGNFETGTVKPSKRLMAAVGKALGQPI